MIYQRLSDILTSLARAAGYSSITLPSQTAITSPKIPLPAELDRLKEIVNFFTTNISYNPPVNSDSSSSDNTKLEKALQEDLELWHIKSAEVAYLNKVCTHAAAMAEFSYRNHDFRAKLQIAKFTWFMIYLDDLAHKAPASLQGFQLKVLQKRSLDDPVLQHFSDNLADMYTFWDILPANSIVCAAFEFLNGCMLEIHPDIQSMVVCSSSPSWPYYLRAKTGVAPAYALMIFTKEKHPKISNYMQVVGDINLFIDLTNDVLSFYKETLAGETANYVHNRSATTGKHPYRVLADIADEALAAHTRVSSTLMACDTKEAYNSWETFVNGYIAFHVTQERYRLVELLQPTC